MVYDIPNQLSFFCFRNNGIPAILRRLFQDMIEYCVKRAKPYWKVFFSHQSEKAFLHFKRGSLCECDNKNMGGIDAL